MTFALVFLSGCLFALLASTLFKRFRAWLWYRQRHHELRGALYLLLGDMTRAAGPVSAETAARELIKILNADEGNRDSR